MRRYVNLAVGIILSLVFLYLAFRSVDFRELWKIIQQTNYVYVGLGGILVLSTYYIRALRWRYLLLPIKDIPPSRLLSPLMIGFMGNCVLPARMGEFLRAYVAGKKENISKSSAFATVVMSRLFDGLSLLLFFWIILLFIAPDFDDLNLNIAGFTMTISWNYASLLFFLLYVGVIAFLVVLYFWQALALSIVRKVLFFLPSRWVDRVLGILVSFVDGLHIIRNGRGIFFVSFYSILVWAGFGFSYYPLLAAIPFDVTFPYYTGFLLAVVVSFGAAIPAAPGFVGTFHYFLILGVMLAAPNANSDQAAALALITHAIQVIPVIIIGVIYFMAEHLSLRNIQKEAS